MSSETEIVPLSPEEQALRYRQVRKAILIRATFIGLILAAWWIMFVPESMMEGNLKIILGIVAGFLAAGSYLFNLRETLFPKLKKSQLAEK
ncbi:MAG: hypothetical protein IPJ38_05725 [Dechloromonas sp.]|jgi:hypothetical protein|uniref:Uncharacterized protein n=1 Tax=Candidatus Dechloromonas phosphorivorans TaxID=2899244 RepID=A0A935MQC3_9RHOO|nr:hypothetical protein [Candidatus Dechloromonas phosphorivorans]